jgi:hypothetical protein
MAFRVRMHGWSVDLVITASIGSSDRAIDELSAPTWERCRGPATSRMILMRSTEGGRFCSSLRSRRDVATLLSARRIVLRGCRS